MVNNSTNINKTNYHLSPQINEHKDNNDIWCWKFKSWFTCGGLKPVNGIPTLPLKRSKDLMTNMKSKAISKCNSNNFSTFYTTIPHLFMDRLIQ